MYVTCTSKPRPSSTLGHGGQSCVQIYSSRGPNYKPKILESIQWRTRKMPMPHKLLVRVHICVNGFLHIACEYVIFKRMYMCVAACYVCEWVCGNV